MAENKALAAYQEQVAAVDAQRKKSVDESDEVVLLRAQIAQLKAEMAAEEKKKDTIDAQLTAISVFKRAERAALKEQFNQSTRTLVAYHDQIMAANDALQAALDRESERVEAEFLYPEKTAEVEAAELAAQQEASAQLQAEIDSLKAEMARLVEKKNAVDARLTAMGVFAAGRSELKQEFNETTAELVKLHDEIEELEEQ